MQINIHPSGYSVQDFPAAQYPFTSIHVHDTGSDAAIYLHSVADADELIAAVVEARAKLMQHKSAEVAA